MVNYCSIFWRVLNSLKVRVQSIPIRGLVEDGPKWNLSRRKIMVDSTPMSNESDYQSWTSEAPVMWQLKLFFDHSVCIYIYYMYMCICVYYIISCICIYYMFFVSHIWRGRNKTSSQLVVGSLDFSKHFYHVSSIWGRIGLFTKTSSAAPA